MTDHYFSADPGSPHDRREITFAAAGRTLRCVTDAGTFSRGHLDPGSALLIEHLPGEAPARILDLGCGWGALTLAAAASYPQARITAVDVNPRALDLCRENLRRNDLRAETLLSDGFAAVQGRYDLILTNPPIRAGKAVVYRLYQESAAHLTPEGALLLVVRKQQGAPSTKEYLSTLFAQVDLLDRNKGYWILRGTDVRTKI